MLSITSENVAKDYGITREEQDRFAAESFRRAEHAQKQGWFKGEIVPVKVSSPPPFRRRGACDLLEKAGD